MTADNHDVTVNRDSLGGQPTADTPPRPPRLEDAAARAASEGKLSVPRRQPTVRPSSTYEGDDLGASYAEKMARPLALTAADEAKIAARLRPERFKQWLGNVPLVSLILMKLCSCGGSVVRAEWRWKRCNGR